MTEKQTTLEVIAPTIDEAVTKGLAELGLPLEAIDVEILDEGSRGFLGLGSRQALVRLTVKPGGQPAVRAEETPSKPHPEPAAPPATRPETRTAPGVEDRVERAELGDARAVQAAADVVRELLAKMKVPAEVTARLGAQDEMHRHPPVHVDIRGKDLSILIGRRAATLNALQYVARLIVSKEMGRSVFLVVDVEGYRERREHQLRQLARRMADQAIQSGRRQVLEPMPPNERRIIHITLQEDPQVTTESVGEEPRRKVTILPT